MQSDILDPMCIPLHSRHLIEASAGTGKTYNITRIYVRLLVEKQLSVQQILVMTFTEAATEEIRQRIATFINDLLQQWDTKPCEFSQSLQGNCDPVQAKLTLELAALELDLASIYTIHGFCQRVLTRFGLSMGTPQDATLKTDFSHILLRCVEDSLLSLCRHTEKFALLQQKNWHEPKRFLQEFMSLLLSPQHLQLNESSQEALLSSLYHMLHHAWEDLLPERQNLVRLYDEHCEALLCGLKASPANEKKIRLEIEQASQWLEQADFIDADNYLNTLTEWVNGSLKNDDFVPKAYKNLLSTARLKNIRASCDVDAQHPLLTSFQRINDQLQEAGFSATGKNALNKAILASETFAVVYEVVQDIQQRVAFHKIQHKVIGFDDLIVSVASALSDGNDDLINTLRGDYPVALVDEFQDTDAYQYRILDTLYPRSSMHYMLVMIGDPKQAIYSFRGGDIFTYLHAKKEADHKWNMSTNYRSSKALIHAYNRLFFGKPLPTALHKNDHAERPLPTCANLFDYGIEYHVIDAPDDQSAAPQLLDTNKAQSDSAMTFVVPSASRIKTRNEQSNRAVTKETSVKLQNAELLNWFAQETIRLLATAKITQNNEQRNVQPEDIAILVRDGKQAKLVKQAFSDKGLATVYLSEKSPLFKSVHAHNVYWLLTALQQPNKTSIRRALTTGLLVPRSQGNNEAIRLLENDEHPLWETIYNRVSDYSFLWLQEGIYALIQSITQQLNAQGVGGTIIDAERSLTNYLHVAEELAKAEITERRPLQLLNWLQQQITNGEALETSQLRLESDNKLIKIVTQHKSKGLEYPIVFLPFANQVNAFPMGNVLSYHNHQAQSRIQLGWSPEASVNYNREQLAEDMRLLYVALTRPILRTYIGMAGSVKTNSSALMRALGIAVESSQEYEDLGAWLRQQIICSLSDINHHFTVCDAGIIPEQCDYNAQLNVHNAACLPFNSTINNAWQVTSFTQMSKAFTSIDVEQQKHTSISFQRDDEMTDSSQASDTTDVTNEAVHYAFLFPKGPDAGNYLHDLLEWIDFSASDLEQQVITQGPHAKGVHQIGSHQIDTHQMSVWLRDILHAPLPKSDCDHNDAFCLAQLTEQQVLKEAEFYFSLQDVNLHDVARLANDYRQQLASKYGFKLS
ncbi:MAG: UvrD-helicase domain-containing protein, partial [Glaciecola sp.]